MQPLRTLSFGEFLEAVGSKTPAPGGGAVASAAGALAAALARMVVAYSEGKKSLAEHEPLLQRAALMLSRTIDLLLELATEDAQAYGLVNELMRLPEGDLRRISELPLAADAAVQAPRSVCAVCCDLMRLLESLQPRTNRHLRSDLAIAAVLAEAAAKAAWWNVFVNLPLIDDETRRAAIQEELGRMLDEAAARCNTIEAACKA